MCLLFIVRQWLHAEPTRSERYIAANIRQLIGHGWCDVTLAYSVDAVQTFLGSLNK